MSAFQAIIGTRTGDRHTREGEENQDFACYALLPDNQGVIAAVSDGAGSAAKAAQGSRAAATAAVGKAIDTASRQGDSIDLQEIVLHGIEAAREALEAKAQGEDSSLEDYHATLIVAGLSATHAAVAHIGDGASIAKVGGKYKMMTIPARGLYPNETFFVTIEDYQAMVATNETCDADEVILFTDGVQDELIDFKGKKPRSEAVESAAATTEEPLHADDEQLDQDHNQLKQDGDTAGPLRTDTYPRLREWLEAREGTHRDDATLLIMYRLERQP